jgi:hypothetical protein
VARCTLFWTWYVLLYANAGGWHQRRALGWLIRIRHLVSVDQYARSCRVQNLGSRGGGPLAHADATDQALHCAAGVAIDLRGKSVYKYSKTSSRVRAIVVVDIGLTRTALLLMCQGHREPGRSGIHGRCLRPSIVVPQCTRRNDLGRNHQHLVARSTTRYQRGAWSHALLQQWSTCTHQARLLRVVALQHVPATIVTFDDVVSRKVRAPDGKTVTEPNLASAIEKVLAGMNEAHAFHKSINKLAVHQVEPLSREFAFLLSAVYAGMLAQQPRTLFGCG